MKVGIFYEDFRKMLNLNKKNLIDATGSEKHSVGCDTHHADPLGVAPERVHTVARLDLKKQQKS